MSFDLGLVNKLTAIEHCQTGFKMEKSIILTFVQNTMTNVDLIWNKFISKMLEVE